MPQVKGFTLLELIVTSAILLTLISIGIPAIAEWQHQAKSTTLQYALLHNIQYTRKQAVHLQTPITLCPGEAGCLDHWTENILIFTDNNRNAVRDAGETLLKTITLGSASKQLHWNRSKPYLRFASQGISSLTGTLKYCSESNQRDYDFGIVVSRTGRIRVTDDVDCS